MAARNVVQIVINAKDDASAILGGVGGALEGLGKFALGATAAVAGAAVGIGAAITKLAVDAAPIEGVRAAFEGLADSANIGADEMLASLERGSAGMIAQADLMTSFNKAAQLVSVDFAQTLPDAMSYLGKVAASSGQDMGFLLDSLVTGVGRLSPMILDNLGIQVNLTEASEAWAEANGVAVSEMTKEQQQAALTAQVLEKLAENTAAMPDVAGSAAASMAQMQATMTNLKNDIGTAFIPVLQAVLEPILSIAEEAGPKLIEWAQIAAEWLGENIPVAIENLKSFWAAAWPVIQDAIDTVWPIIQDVFDKIKTWMENDGPGALDKIKTAFGDAWSFIREQVDKVVKWFENNLPLIQETGETLVKFWETKIAPALDNVWEIIKTVVSTAIDSVLGIIRVIMQVITGDWEGAWETIKETASGVWDSIKLIAQEFIEGVLNSVGTTTDDLIATWEENWEMAKTIVSTAWENIKMSVAEAIETLKGSIQEKFESIKQAAEEIWENIKNAILEKLRAWFDEMGIDLDEFIEEWRGILDRIFAIADEIWSNITTFITEKITEIRDTIAPILDEILGKFSEIYESIRTTVEEKITEAKEIVNTIVSDIVISISEKAGDFLQAAKDVMDSLLKGLGEKAEEITTWLFDLGVNMITAIKDGVNSVLAGILDFFTGAIKDVIGRVEDELGMDSPSKVFMAIGENMMAGLAVGISGAVAVPVEAAGNATSSIINNTTNFNQTINVQDSDAGMEAFNGFQDMRAMVRA